MRFSTSHTILRIDMTSPSRRTPRNHPLDLLRAIAQPSTSSDGYLQRMDETLDGLESQLAGERLGDDAMRVPNRVEFVNAWAIPVLANGAPDKARSLRLAGFQLDGRRVILQLDGDSWPKSSHWMLAGRAADGAMRYGEVWIEPSEASGTGPTVIGHLATQSKCVLCPENLTPRVDLRTGRMIAPIARAIADAWCELGVLEPFVVDRVLSCPECESITTVRRGCRNCGSVHAASRSLIHHYACAYVGPAEQFDRQGEIACPKCRAHSLIVGADYEYISGPHDCSNCGWSDTQLEEIAECVRCRLRFPLEQAQEKDVVAYHVERLGLLADDAAT